MRVLVCGAGENGVNVIRQLRKNENIEIIVLDPRENPYGLREGIIEKIDIKEALTPLTIDFVIDEIKPELILFTMEAEDLGLGSIAGLEVLSSAMRDEVTSISSIPFIQVARTKAR